MNTSIETLFPAFERFIDERGLLANATGILQVRLHQIHGQGTTRAEGLDLPPATVERQQYLIALKLPDEAVPGPDVVQEIEDAKREVDAHVERMRHPENRRRFALQALGRIEEVPTGFKDNHFFAGRLVLVSDNSGLNWSWSMTPHYPVIDKIPADVNYVFSAYLSSVQAVKKWTLPVERFLDRLDLAWSMARHYANSDDVLIDDVARMFKVAVQEQRFWGKPQRRNFKDVPEAVFIANLINWRQQRNALTGGHGFELVPATLHQAHGAKTRPFFVPGNVEGTVVRPMIYMRRKKD